MKDWHCHALGISKDDLFDPSCVPFAPCWTVGFNSRFRSLNDENVIDDDAYNTVIKVEAWVAENAGARMVVFPSGEVMCESETDATLLFLAFR